jgi:hypothetical protein
VEKAIKLLYSVHFMAIEIKEFVIRAVVDYSASADEKGQAPHQDRVDGEDNEQSAIIDACVKEVLKIIERKQKR